MKRNFFAGAALVLSSVLLLAGCNSDDDPELEYEMYADETVISDMPDRIGNDDREIDMSKYELAFSDDFNGDSLDPTKWEPCPEWERQTHLKNNGWWSNDCVSVKDGNLVLECKKGDGKFKSGAVRTKTQDHSRELFSQCKGIWEIKFRVQRASGLWYAFWLMADNTNQNIGNGAVDGAEIDMFELLPGKSSWQKNGKDWVTEPNRFMTTLHWDEYGSSHKQAGVNGFSVMDFDPKFYSSYHIFKFVWTDEGYTCYLDGRKLWFLKGEEYGGGTCRKSGYMKISSEFGDWGGPLDGTVLVGGSKKFFVDYVKVYKEK